MARKVYEKTHIKVSAMSDRAEYMRQWNALRRGGPPLPLAYGRVKSPEKDRRLRRDDIRVTSWASRARRNLMKSASARGLEFSRAITSRWIHERWRLQHGRCFYTGVPFEITAAKRGLRRPSLDRLDSSLGYVPENVVLCLVAVNYAKNDATVDELMSVLWAIVNENRHHYA